MPVGKTIIKDFQAEMQEKGQNGLSKKAKLCPLDQVKGYFLFIFRISRLKFIMCVIFKLQFGGELME